jgi:DNA-binding response OmpR family regulator
MSLAREHAGPIDMLLSDMLMPQMSGVDLARALRDTRPTLKVLFMSGYSEDSLGPAALEQLGARLLAKPFNASGLLGQIRAMLSGSE